MEKRLLIYSMPFPSIDLFTAIQENNITELLIDESIRFEKMSYRNRYYVTGAQGVHLLTIPVAHGRNQRIPLNEVAIDNNTAWQKNHWKTLTTHYMRTPYFEFIAPFLSVLYEQKFEQLVDFNRASIKVLQQLLKLKTKITIVSNLQEVDLDNCLDWRRCIKPNANFPNTTVRNYHQIFMDRCGFIPNLAVLDYMFNEGIHL